MLRNESIHDVLPERMQRPFGKGLKLSIRDDLWVHVKSALFVFVFGNFLFASVYADVGFQKVRFARGDVDGDGVVEVIAGGRIGEAVAIDVPRGLRRAGLGVYHTSGQLLTPVAVCEDLQVVQDVAAADLNGDGRAEIVSVGMGRLNVFGWKNGELAEIDRVNLGGQWTDRVAAGDVDGDGQAEVAITLYHVDADAEIGHTRIVIYTWANHALVQDRDWIMAQHVGDLAALSEGWVMEVGSGEEGGVLQAVNLQGWPVWKTSAAGSPRALSLDTVENRLVVGRVDGLVRMYWMDTGRPQLLDQRQVSFLSGLLLFSGPQKALMVGTHRTGIVWVEF